MNIITLNGWGQPHDGLKVLAPNATHLFYSQHDSSTAFFNSFRHHAEPEIDVMIGWSLGGQLAVRLVAEGLASPRLLVLLGAPYQFVACGDFPAAMPPEMNAAFRDSYLANTHKTVKKFTGLIGKGDRLGKKVMTRLGEHQHSSASVKRWLPWLDELSNFSCSKLNFELFPPTLLIHGAQDAIVRSKHAEAFAEKLPQVHLEIWDGCGHAPHLHNTARIKALMKDMLAA